MAESIAELKAAVDLGALVALDLGQPRKKGGRWLFWRCPFHRDTDPSFGVTSDTGRFKCFGCGEIGDHLDWLSKRRNLATGAAIQELRRVAGLPEMVKAPEVANTSTGGNDSPPPERWQESGRAFAAWAAEQLWSGAGDPGLAYLRAGGLTDDTIRSWGLGWCPEWKSRDPKRWGLEGGPVNLARGVVIPCEVAGVLWYIKVRRFDAQGRPETEHGSKYSGPRAGRGALFGADRLRSDGRILLFSEGERDCMLAWQELGDLVDVATLGGAGKRSLGRWALWLLSYRRILTAFDTDQAGRDGAAWWAELSNRAASVQVPSGADLTDYHAGGGDLRAWLAAPIMRTSCQGSPLDGTSGDGGELVDDAELLGADIADSWVLAHPSDDRAFQVDLCGVRIVEQVDPREFACVCVQRPDLPTEAWYLCNRLGEGAEGLCQFCWRDAELEVDL